MKDFQVFAVPMTPVGKGRPRVGRFGARTPPETRAAEMQVGLFARRAIRQPLEGPVAIWVFAVFPVPKSVTKAEFRRRLTAPHTSTPDADNIAKLVLDALNGIAYRDDGQVADLRATKAWGQSGKVLVMVGRADPQPFAMWNAKLLDWVGPEGIKFLSEQEEPNE